MRAAPRRESRDDPDAPHLEQRYKAFVELGIRLAALALLVYGSLILIWPFLTIAIWSVVLTVALYPIYEKIAHWVGGRRRLAAAILTILNFLIIIGPATWLALDLIESIKRLSEKLSSSSFSIPPPPISIQSWPIIGSQLYDFLELASTNVEAAAAPVLPLLKPLGTQALAVAGSAGIGILMFFAAIIVAGFLFAPAPSLVATLTSFSRRLTLQRGEEFVQLAGATIRSVSRGVIGISALQALLAGLALGVAKIPGASVITSAVLVLGIIQIGPAIVLVPIIIWAWFLMPTTDALLFTLYMVPVNLMDNVLRPLVIGKGLKTPMLVILVGVIGGTLAYGIIGVFLGPIVLAVIWELLVAWMAEAEAAG
jgi:predicted PurR-regulated permease PerM